MRRIAVTLALALVALCSLWPDDTTTSAPTQTTPQPEPYKLEEFPQWLVDTRRFEVISVGAFPLTYFFGALGVDTYRWVSSGYEIAYAPWPFKNANSAPRADSEKYAILLIAGGLSLSVATIDLLIRSSARHKAALKARAEAAAELKAAQAPEPAPSTGSSP